MTAAELDQELEELLELDRLETDRLEIDRLEKLLQGDAATATGNKTASMDNRVEKMEKPFRMGQRRSGRMSARKLSALS